MQLRATEWTKYLLNELAMWALPVWRLGHSKLSLSPPLGSWFDLLLPSSTYWHSSPLHHIVLDIDQLFCWALCLVWILQLNFPLKNAMKSENTEVTLGNRIRFQISGWKDGLILIVHSIRMLNNVRSCCEDLEIKYECRPGKCVAVAAIPNK